MGSQSVKAITSQKERKKYIYHLLNDVKALEKMVEEDLFEKNIQRVGAEQELCITNNNFRPSFNALKILEKIKDPHFATELALFNLEVNLDHVELSGRCFSSLEKQLKALLAKAYTVAESVDDNKILLSGILPTLKKKDLILENMTPFERYKIINDVLRSIRGDDFKLRIRGVDEMILKHDSILFEACNTSFQVHLQIGLDEAVDKYNWAQAIAGPVMSIMTNSPLLFGRELWSETRIALFQQSVDMRNTSYLLREQKPRVSFGNGWIKKSIVELFTDDIARYTPILTGNFDDDSLENLKKGVAPELRALQLHNGTLYKWNRLCYGIGDNNKPHIRIENRYIPSGPSIKDEIANAMFWVGVMQGMPSRYKNIWKLIQFKDARGNFINAARTGIDTYFNWFGEGISARKLARTILLPIAREGLEISGINKTDIDYYLNIIQKRIEKNTCGSKWLIRSNRNLRKSVSNDQANILLTYNMYKNQRADKPIYQWKLAKTDSTLISTKKDKLYKVMTTELFVVNENDLVELVDNIMKWKNIHHLPVVNSSNKITGIITQTTLDSIDVEKAKDDLIVAKDIMVKKVISVSPETIIEDAKNIMLANNIGCLPILEAGELIGIFTKNDLLKIDKE
ncbi:MAG: CBS domain-containing protein [Flavobacteriaceae bacterium]|jgi:CBS domain-containing protein|nr:CBS domain-containing protein [Flavobacteriaceae bacterium]